MPRTTDLPCSIDIANRFWVLRGPRQYVALAVTCPQLDDQIWTRREGTCGLHSLANCVPCNKHSITSDSLTEPTRSSPDSPYSKMNDKSLNPPSCSTIMLS